MLAWPGQRDRDCISFQSELVEVNGVLGALIAACPSNDHTVQDIQQQCSTHLHFSASHFQHAPVNETELAFSERLCLVGQIAWQNVLEFD